MKLAPRQWLRSVHNKLPEPRVLLAPGHLFFSKALELDPSMSRDEIDDFVNLSIEGLSPFPVEQLTWGYLRPEGSNEVLVYATPLSRLRSQSEDDLESYFHVFPSFVAALREDAAEVASIRFLASANSLTALYFEAGKRLPSAVVSRPLRSGSSDDTSLLEGRTALATKIDTDGYQLEEGLWLIEGFFVGAQNRVFSHHRNVVLGKAGETIERPVELTDLQLQAADVRPTALTAKNLKDRQLALRLWQGMQIVAACFILLLLFQFGVWGLSKFTRVIDTRYNQRERIVNQVLQREDFIQRLSLDSLQSVDPTLMLTMINDVRPDTIYFSDAAADAINQITVKGVSQVGAETVNLYVEKLKGLEVVNSVENTPTTKDSQTSFEITVTFDLAILAAAAERLNVTESLVEGEAQ